MAPVMKEIRIMAQVMKGIGIMVSSQFRDNSLNHDKNQDLGMKFDMDPDP